MAYYSKSQCQAMLDALYQAQLGLASGALKQYTLNGRTITKHTLGELDNTIREWEARLANADRQSIGCPVAVMGTIV